VEDLGLIAEIAVKERFYERSKMMKSGGIELDESRK